MSLALLWPQSLLLLGGKVKVPGGNKKNIVFVNFSVRKPCMFLETESFTKHILQPILFYNFLQENFAVFKLKSMSIVFFKKRCSLYLGDGLFFGTHSDDVVVVAVAVTVGGGGFISSAPVGGGGGGGGGLKEEDRVLSARLTG